MTHESPELIELFTTYTAAPDSIGRLLAAVSGHATSNAPLLVATSTDLALYRGGSHDPEVLGFRMSTRGFKELAGVSHLGPALASLVALRQAEPHGAWQRGAERLLAASRTARRANSVPLWQDVIAVDAYKGREAAIARMVDYALHLTIGFLERSLADPALLTFDALHEEYLHDGDDRPVSFDRIMIATFYLVGMDIASRLIDWLDRQNLDWKSAMILIAGRQGRATAGVTYQTNSVASMIVAASRGRLPLDHVYLAPHAPTFTTPVDGDLREVAGLESELRALWSGTRAVSELGASMFTAYPAFSFDTRPQAAITTDVQTVGELPHVSGPQDWLSLITRLRVVMEDPRQLLSGAVSDVAARDLIAHDNDPNQVVVPGLDFEPYPDLR